MKLKIDILPNEYLKKDGTFDKERAINICGKIAGVCYDPEGFNHLINEPVEKTNRRINMTLNNGHHSVYDHIYISFNIQNISKILAMVLNNEKEYTTSEKSARYTKIVRSEDSVITSEEEHLYNKWLEIFKNIIKDSYGYIYNDSKITKLAQENARYLVTVFMDTQMIYTTSLRQINYIVSWMREYISNVDKNNLFEVKLSNDMKEFIDEIDMLNILEPGLLTNEKHRTISLFGKDLDDKKDIFTDTIYQTKYEATFAEVGQAQRHRTLNYKIELNENKFFVPPIIEEDKILKQEWLNDISSVSDIIPQGRLVTVFETGTLDMFLLKCKERLCSAAQLEIMLQTKDTLLKYKKALEEAGDPKSKELESYTKGARCTFKDFECSQDCKFKEGKTLTRRI